MTPDELQIIADAAECRLPDVYVALLMDFPEFLTQPCHDSGERLADYELLDDTETISQLNREVRLEPLVDVEGSEFDWPPSLIVIGENRSGDYYCLDAESDGPDVICFDHQASEFEIIAESLAEFLNLLEGFFSEDAEDSV